MTNVIDLDSRREATKSTAEAKACVALSEQVAALLNRHVDIDVPLELVVLMLYRTMLEGISKCQNPAHMAEYLVERLNKDRERF